MKQSITASVSLFSILCTVPALRSDLCQTLYEVNKWSHENVNHEDNPTIKSHLLHIIVLYLHD